MLAKFLKRGSVVALFVATLVAITVPAIATPDVWNWTDASSLLPFRDGQSIVFSASTKGATLLSDGEHAYRFDGTTLTDLTGALRGRDIQTVSGVWSDTNKWLVASTNPTDTKTRLYVTDGSSWMEMGNGLRLTRAGVDASGYKGQWYIRTYESTPDNATQLGSWSLVNGEGSTPVSVQLPATISMNRAGCMGGSACTGVQTFTNINGTWYFLGGSMGTQGSNGKMLQEASAGIWNVNGNGTTLTPLTGIPVFKYVSGVWNGGSEALIGTSDVDTNPFAMDRLWLFNGKELREVTSQALAMGLMSTDARDVRAAWNGRSWMILGGKRLTRYDGTTMTAQEQTRDAFQTISSNGNGLFVLGGAESTQGSQLATLPLTAKLTTVEENLNAPVPSGSVKNEVLSALYGPKITIDSNPNTLRIGDGKTFAFTATAESPNGIDHIDIYVQGAKVKSCYDNSCTYTQVYWTNHELTRRVDFVARAVDTKGYANDTKQTWLVVDQRSNATGPVVVDERTPVVIPSLQTWTQDEAAPTMWTEWLDPRPSVLLTSDSVTYHVAAKDARGVTSIEVWVNGKNINTCSFSAETLTIRQCSFTLRGADYGFGTTVFANANIRSTNKNAWTKGVSIVRDTTPAKPKGVSAQSTHSTASTALTTATSQLAPNTGTTMRGTAVTYTVSAQNNILGIDRIEISLNGQIYRTCKFGNAMSRVDCTATVDTMKYTSGATLTFAGWLVDTQGHTLNAETRSVGIRTNTQQTNTTSATRDQNMTAWTWLAPMVSELTEGRTTTYSVGSWSPNGVTRIEMIVDGTVRGSCVWTAGTGNRECSYDVKTSDWSHGHTVSVNARVIDAKGNIVWTEPRVITIKRSWEPTGPASYVQLEVNRPTGYLATSDLTFTMRGWSQSGVKKIELFVNGAIAATCPTDACTYTLKNVIIPTVEYSARLTDSLGRETWTDLKGTERQ